MSPALTCVLPPPTARACHFPAGGCHQWGGNTLRCYLYIFLRLFCSLSFDWEVASVLTHHSLRIFTQNSCTLSHRLYPAGFSQICVIVTVITRDRGWLATCSIALQVSACSLRFWRKTIILSGSLSTFPQGAMLLWRVRAPCSSVHYCTCWAWMLSCWAHVVTSMQCLWVFDLPHWVGASLEHGG